MSTKCGSPMVNVPVLSKAMASNLPRASSGAPPFINTPPRAARATPDRMALGVAIAKAQGLRELKYVENKFIGVGNIKAILFNHKGRNYYAFRYLSENKKIESYFNENGESMQKALLSAPLEYVRISSKFSRSRLHPIKKIYRPHYGVDYAAPLGTDVVSTGDGEVVFVGRSGGAGKMIKIKHAFGNVITKYLHLHKYAKGITVGKYVEQGQKIGEVGSTGLSTGPHLDYRVYINGSPQNPLKLDLPSKDPIPNKLKAKYISEIDKIKGTLDNITFLNSEN
mgnify:CR=1 FL=1